MKILLNIIITINLDFKENRINIKELKYGVRRLHKIRECEKNL
ncbi:hypothetical protein [Streptobacillus moniliformis]|nr:hypothetical protein [Streptobacillus moniliformis]